jgi:peptide/nickel transport system permease protein
MTTSMSTAPAPSASAVTPMRPGRLARLAHTMGKHPMVAMEVALVVAVLVVSFLAPILTLADPNIGQLLDSLAPPLSPNHVLGTDFQGRDILSRIVYGARTSILISLSATIAALLIGLSLGLMAGYIRWLDAAIMRLVDIQLSFPSLVLAIAIVAALGGAKIINVVIVLIVTGWVSYARVARGMVLALKESLYVEAARSIGVPSRRILVVDIMPNVLPTMIAMAVAQLSMFMIQEASLSYLGLGVPASTPTLGVMLQQGQQTLFVAWWPAILPAIAMAMLVLLLTSLGDFLSQEAGKL